MRYYHPNLCASTIAFGEDCLGLKYGDEEDYGCCGFLWMIGHGSLKSKCRTVGWQAWLLKWALLTR
jgi:hypothetical protein